MNKNETTNNGLTLEIPEMHLHHVRFFLVDDVEYEGDGKEEIISQFKTYNPVPHNVGDNVWFGIERYEIVEINHGYEYNDGENLLDIHIILNPLEEIEECQLCPMRKKGM